MTWAMTVLSLASLVLAGACLLAAVGALPDQLTHAVASSFAAGAALLAATGTVMIVLGLRLTILPMYALIVVLGGLALRRRISRPTAALARDRIARVLLVASALCTAAIVVASLDDRLWWDGWAIWSLKGRVLFHDLGLSPAFLDPDGGWVFTHLGYPLALPLLDWWSFSHAGVAAPAIASFLGAAAFAVLPLLVWNGVRERAGERVAALSTLGMTLFWPIAFYATGGTADVIIAIALLGIVIELDRAVTLADAGALPRTALFLALGALAKNEGLAVAAVSVPMAAIALIYAGRTRVRRLAWLLLPFVVFMPWWLFVSGADLGSSVFSGSAFPAVAANAAGFASGVIDLFSSAAWIAVPLIAGVGFVAAARRRVPGITAGWIVLGTYFCTVAAAYVFSPDDIEWLIATSLPRVVGVMVAPLVVLSASAAATTDAAS